jgi:hypothetical protein
MPLDPSREFIIDQEHLKLLSIGYIISGVLTAFGAVIGLMYAFVGVGVGTILHTVHPANGQPPPAFIGWIFSAIGISIFWGLGVVAAVKFYTAKFLKQRKHRVFCMIVAAFTCLGLPYGTILGIFSFMVLARTSVIRTFDQIPASVPPAAPGGVSRT